MSESDVFPPLIDRCWVLSGPTASGKSSLAIALAERIGGEIISMDSMAVYRAMDVGTAKPDASQRRRVPHHLIDVVDPDEAFSVACFLKHAHELVEQIHRRRRVPILVGGTPMYLKAVLRGFDPGPPAEWEFRRQVERDVAEFGLEALRERLRQVDPLAAHRLHPNDQRRMVRALEVARAGGIPLSHRQLQLEQQRAASQCRVFACAWPRAELHRRINRRVEQMFAAGLVEETRELLRRFGRLSRTAAQAVGYAETIQHLEGRLTLAQTIEQVQTHTRQLARRQETFLRSLGERTELDMAAAFSGNADVDAAAQALCQRMIEHR
ncbi:tRNA (adenosine(37)-N6)-dimethylallyltransferase MiaA [Roseimaritima sediminicola]|uniref:tRNA (adenosine(37)-N6)-dimethylallyltransferase MiaA n=1 Tax=Roseimaritima sediminicola TaxID=2662066 RepID=UPI001386C116|nr:tRNA (adenosine(37)-N6)-dimethylallyltransferase MiaA [Roseimaritima sediminicola]